MCNISLCMVLLSAVDGAADLIILKLLGYICCRYKLVQHSGVASLC